MPSIGIFQDKPFVDSSTQEISFKNQFSLLQNNLQPVPIVKPTRTPRRGHSNQSTPHGESQRTMTNLYKPILSGKKSPGSVASNTPTAIAQQKKPAFNTHTRKAFKPSGAKSVSKPKTIIQEPAFMNLNNTYRAAVPSKPEKLTKAASVAAANRSGAKKRSTLNNSVYSTLDKTGRVASKARLTHQKSQSTVGTPSNVKQPTSAISAKDHTHHVTAKSCSKFFDGTQSSKMRKREKPSKSPSATSAKNMYSTPIKEFQNQN